MPVKFSRRDGQPLASIAVDVDVDVDFNSCVFYHRLGMSFSFLLRTSRNSGIWSTYMVVDASLCVLEDCLFQLSIVIGSLLTSAEDIQGCAKYFMYREVSRESSNLALLFHNMRLFSLGNLKLAKNYFQWQIVSAL